MPLLSENATPYHIPALLPQVLEGLDIKPGGTYVDVTFGGGGHSRAILDALDKDGRLYSFDQDIDAVSRAFDDLRFTIVYSNFRYLSNFMTYYGVGAIDGLLADLGVSFHHFDDPSRGFSFRWDDSPLDMRMNAKAEKTAAQLLQECDDVSLARIFRLYGELKNAGQLAKAIVAARNQGRPLATASDLYAVIKSLINPAREKKELACVYQALRIAVNNELEVLKKLLVDAAELIRPGGRIAIITYHSLEDRMVKNFLKTGRVDGESDTVLFGNDAAPFKPLGGKPIVPDEAEIEANPRARSAKLRIAVRR